MRWIVGITILSGAITVNVEVIATVVKSATMPIASAIATVIRGYPVGSPVAVDDIITTVAGYDAVVVAILVVIATVWIVIAAVWVIVAIVVRNKLLATVGIDNIISTITW